MERISTWEAALSDYITAKRKQEFEYGVHDCCTFTFGAVEAMTGEDLMAPFRGQYNSLASSVVALRDIGQGDLESTVDAHLPIIPIGRAQRGDVVLYDGSIGVVAGGYAWFVSDDGFERIPRIMWDKAWSVGRG